MTNTQALGYVLLAAKSLKLNEKEIVRLVSQVEVEMEFWTEEAADEEYDDWSDEDD